VCRRLLSRIRETKVSAEATEVKFTVSAGLTEIIPSGDEADAILKRADRALYRAKELGRDRCEVG
jgi:diguanylate cyclase (GGDEF)-like protein